MEEEMRNKKYLIITAGIIMILLFSAFSKAGGGPVTDIPRTISVTGTGKVTIVPDIATINVGVHTENEDVSAALAENNAKAMSVRDALVKFGVKAEDIQTTSFTIYPNQQYGPMGEMLGVKYAVDNSVFITVRDLTKMGEVLSTIVNQGANNIYGINFDVSDREKALKEARLAAIADAKLQADELAAAAGVKVGQVMSISISTTNLPIPMYADYGKGGGGAMAAAPAPISGGQLIISVDAYLSYEIN
jgi:uncharacterized protein YggE